MREILFRGKVPDDSRDEELRGKWVEGNLIHQTEYYGHPVERYHILYTGEFDYDYYDSVIVIPETVGQYTGLIDKNGKKIFEGDIIKCHVEYNIGCYPHTETVTVVVRYSDGCFIPFNRCEKDFYEVIGNIHDNPELLEEKK